jgi:hypothetical protein
MAIFSPDEILDHIESPLNILGWFNKGYYSLRVSE